jgi:DNA-directed RNA polymerase subunit H (RpoH/RPB5)
MDTIFLYRFGRALINCMYMIRDRGYIVNEICTDPYELAGQLYAKATAQKLSLAEAARAIFKHADGHTIAVWCLDRNYDISKSRERMISTDQMKAINELIDGHEADKHIVLSPNKLSPQAKKEYIRGDLFLFDELMVDLPRHELVVSHSLVSIEAVKNVLGQSLNVQDLPILPMSDPVARWYAFPKGSVVYVNNPSIKTFRVVC